MLRNNFALLYKYVFFEYSQFVKLGLGLQLINNCTSTAADRVHNTLKNSMPGQVLKLDITP